MTVQAAGLAGSKAVSSLGLGLGKLFQIGVYCICMLFFCVLYECSGRFVVQIELQFTSKDQRETTKSSQKTPTIE